MCENVIMEPAFLYCNEERMDGAKRNAYQKKVKFWGVSRYGPRQSYFDLDGLESHDIRFT